MKLILGLLLFVSVASAAAVIFAAADQTNIIAKWDAGLATAAATRLNTLDQNTPLSSQTLGGSVPATQGDVHYGIYKTDTNGKTARQMFGAAWNTAWYGYIKEIGLPQMNYDPNLVIALHTNEKNRNFAYQVASGQARKVGCAYRNFTTGATGTTASGTFAVLCRFNPSGLTSGSLVYSTGKICAACANTTTISCTTANGLCVQK
ncbi:unnamed protein product, partial [Mesorhabditis belari]|uniref:SCP domain-containing protein n=1 Tax=Mesorhabditis belari TaxID=2138241 RepID=A0AAF3FHA9_9BILA